MRNPAAPVPLPRAAAPRQRTIARSVAIEGIGLHSGAAVRAVLRPGEPGAGVVFHLGADEGGPRIPARLEAVAATVRGVVLGAGGARIATVEHLLSACAGAGIDNLLVVVEGGEVPAGDGSAWPFLQALREAGAVEQEEPREVVEPAQPVWAEDGRATMVALPSPHFRATYLVDHPVAGVQMAEFDAASGDYGDAVAGARTWGTLAEADMLRREGLARGASLENTLVMSERGYVNAPRYPDELARHKLLDLMGDLFLLGAPLHAHVIGVRAGHALHVALARRIAETAEPALGRPPVDR